MEQTHPTAQAQATPVSINQNHQLGEKGLEQSTEAELGDQNVSQRPEKVPPSEISGSAGCTKLWVQGKDSSSPQGAASPDRMLLFGQNIFPVSLSYRKMRIICKVSQEPVKVPGAAPVRGKASDLLRSTNPPDSSFLVTRRARPIFHTRVSGSWRTSGKTARPTG